MTETLEHTDATEAPETGLLRRTFAAEMTAGDSRTVDVRVVPYGERITHNDGHGGLAKGVPYQEEWVAGAFAHQLSAANRVLVNVEHEEGIGGIVGHGKALIERQDGLYGSFKIHETPDGDKALLLVREGILSTISLEAHERRSIRAAGGLIRRVKADLVAVALTRFGAYRGAVVLAVREAAILDEDLLPVQPDPELIERCRQLGIKIPQRYQAHPDENGHPGTQAGTPEDGTRLPEDDIESSEEAQ